MEEMTPEDMLFFMYLLTTLLVTQFGFYRIPKKRWLLKQSSLLKRCSCYLSAFCISMSSFVTETRELVIKNWGKHNLRCGG
jgi:hypothetical protein